MAGAGRGAGPRYSDASSARADAAVMASTAAIPAIHRLRIRPGNLLAGGETRAGLVRAVEAFAGVAETGADVATLVELAVDRGAEDRHVGMVGADGVEPFRRRDQ